ncbi:hypothetical protein GQ457_12G003240 [Hibiscus cannabinus]
MYELKVTLLIVFIAVKFVFSLFTQTNSSNEDGTTPTRSLCRRFICLLPRENIGGNNVPVFFHGHPIALYVYVISIVFTLIGSLIPLFIGDDSKTSRFCAHCSTVAMVSTLASIVYACFACLITLLVIL